MTTPTANGEPCPIKTATSVVGGKWKPGILFRLQTGPYRFGELSRTMPWLSDKVLSRALAELVADGVVTRTDFGVMPKRVEYKLSDYGETLRPLLRAMCEWGQAHIARDRE